ncbi:MAG: hypothetical protein GX787_03720 [Tissierellia bacterium]|jgi:hypothetical protein|nr:hypothetical protein [Tissierellia bacterium]
MGVAKIKKAGVFTPSAAAHEVGGAVIPTYFGYNPTHTIEALAFWSSDYIKRESKSGGLQAYNINK